MIQRKLKRCKGPCGEDKYIFSKGLCLSCYKLENKEKFSLNKKKKIVKGRFENDKDFYQTIWESRDHICENCNTFLGNEPRTYHFDHTLEKSKFPDLRYKEDNIMLLCLQCHSSKTNGYYSNLIKDRIKLLAEKYDKNVRIL
jgi:5-methylcytosine-specific restriction endonuclease McrA